MVGAPNNPLWTWWRWRFNRLESDNINYDLNVQRITGFPWTFIARRKIYFWYLLFDESCTATFFFKASGVRDQNWWGELGNGRSSRNPCAVVVFPGTKRNVLHPFDPRICRVYRGVKSGSIRSRVHIIKSATLYENKHNIPIVTVLSRRKKWYKIPRLPV